MEGWINQRLNTYLEGTIFLSFKKCVIYPTLHIFLSYSQIHHNPSFQLIYIHIYIYIYIEREREKARDSSIFSGKKKNLDKEK